MILLHPIYKDYDYLNNYLQATPCTYNNRQPQSPAVTSWISSGTSPAKTSLVVQAGAKSVDLVFWSAGVECYNSRGVQIYYEIVGASASPAGIISSPVGQNNMLDWWNITNSPGAYRKDSTPFTYAPTGGFKSTGTYTININIKVHNNWNGTGMVCTAPKIGRAHV